MPDAAFLTESQRRYGGIPAMLWQEAELRALLLPLLRADLTLVETYTYTPAPPLPCALTASAVRGISRWVRRISPPGVPRCRTTSMYSALRATIFI